MTKYFKRFWPIYIFIVLIFVLIMVAGNHAVTTISEREPIHRNTIIIIDAGHGGEDGGATSCSGILESNINLEIALKLNDLCHLFGFDTKMVRTTDISIYTEGETISAKKASDLRHRVQLVNETNQAVLISIHQNTFTDSQYSGAQVFYAATEGSAELAQILQNQFAQIDSNNHRRIKVASNIYLMQHIKRTGVLIECGFLSNPIEEALLRSAEYKKKICGVVVTGLCHYLSS